MSRLGKLPIHVPAGTQINLEGDILTAKGPKGELQVKIHPAIKLEIKPEEILVTITNQEDKKEKSLWGLFRSLVNNAVVGVNQPFSKKLEINGVGYKVALTGSKLLLNLGFSHPIEFPLPSGVSAVVEANTITLSSIDKQLVGEIAAQIRKLRKPEPYKGKGIKYSDEVIRRKEGKTASK